MFFDAGKTGDQLGTVATGSGASQHGAHNQLNKSQFPGKAPEAPEDAAGAAGEAAGAEAGAGAAAGGAEAGAAGLAELAPLLLI